MAGAAPQETVHKRYSPVAWEVAWSAPSTTRRGEWKRVQARENRRPLQRAHQKPKAEELRTTSYFFCPRARLIMLELPTPNKLLTALKASSTGAARVTAAFCTGLSSIPTK